MNENLNFLNEYRKMIEKSNVLVIGSGGIGCELLKSLVISGFKNISIIDLDQIEKSNLNRQFLFRKSDIGRNKSEIAKLNILKYRPEENLNIQSFVGNIKDTQNYGSDFFLKFDIVLNALDNIDARTHVNRMCNILNIPLVNSGSEGYLGNVQTSLKNLTPCYNCFVKNETKVIPICTLRSKPDKIEHCVAWAKNLFEILYTNSENGSFMLDETLSENNRENLSKFFFLNLVEEKKINEKINPIDIDKVTIWNEKSYENINEEIHKHDNDLFTLEFYVFILFSSNNALEIFNQSYGKFEKFDKENPDIINFVFAASNLRAHTFNINTQTRFKIKTIAGNIVAAIASTNAIVASLQTIEAIKVLTNNKENLKNLHYNMSKEIKSTTAMKENRNEDCVVCSKCENILFLRINIGINDLNFLVKEIIKRYLNVKSPLIWLEKELIYDENDEIDEKFITSPLSKWINNNSILKIRDEDSEKVYKIIFVDNEKQKVAQFEIEFTSKSDIKNKEDTNNEKILNSKIQENNKNDLKNSINENLIVIFDDEDPVINLHENEEEKSLNKKRKHEIDLEDYREILKKI